MQMHLYYCCKHRVRVGDHLCDYKKQWGEDRINAAVEDVIRDLVLNPEFAEAIKKKINTRIDTDELDKELEQYRKQLKQLIGAKRKLAAQMDSLDILDRNYTRKYQDMQERLDSFYDQIGNTEDTISSIEAKIHNLHQEKITGDNIYQHLLYFNNLYELFTDSEKKQFMSSFLKSVELFDTEQPSGRFLKRITFAFPVYYQGKEVRELSWDKETTVETVCLLTHT